MRTIIPHTENPALRKKSVPIAVSDIGSKMVQSLIADMKKLLSKEEYGVALAAPQVGEALQLFIVSGRALEKRKKKYSETAATSDMPPEDEVYINPTITRSSRGTTDKHEGCLSVRGFWGEVPRVEKVTLSALNEKGQKVQRGASGFLAHIFQHEMDHLDGILYTDKATKLYSDEEKV